MKSKKIILLIIIFALVHDGISASDHENQSKRSGLWYTGVATLIGGFSYLFYRIFRSPRPQWYPHESKNNQQFCQGVMKEYNSLSPERKKNLQYFWRTKNFNSRFCDDAMVERYIEVAYHLYAYAKERKYAICCLGQSLSYVVLIVQFFKMLNNEPYDDCYFIALSNDMENITYGDKNFMGYQPPDDSILNIYYEYLKAMGFISDKERTVLVCDQVETARTIIEWESIFNAIKRLLKPGEKMPGIVYYIHHAPLRNLPANMPPVEFSFTMYQETRNLRFPFEKAWNSLINAEDELRLVPSFSPKDWPYTNPFKKPAKGACALAMRFLDYIIEHGMQKALTIESVKRSIVFKEE